MSAESRRRECDCLRATVPATEATCDEEAAESGRSGIQDRYYSAYSRTVGTSFCPVALGAGGR